MRSTPESPLLSSEARCQPFGGGLASGGPSIRWLKSFTFDNFAGSPNPPLVATVTDVEGARLYLQMTDVNPREVKLDMPVELTFRKMHDAGGTPNYYWKCTPVR